MFDKLSKLFGDVPAKEFKPRPQGVKEKISPTVAQESGSKNDSFDKGVLIGHDPFNRKTDLDLEVRMQSKLELLRQLQKELGRYE